MTNGSLQLREKLNQADRFATDNPGKLAQDLDANFHLLSTALVTIQEEIQCTMFAQNALAYLVCTMSFYNWLCNAPAHLRTCHYSNYANQVRLTL
jgi:hypothetical protein